MYESEGKNKDMPSGTGKTKDPAYGWVSKNLDRPVTEEERARVGDQPKGKGPAGPRPTGERPYGKNAPSNPADEDERAM